MGQTVTMASAPLAPDKIAATISRAISGRMFISEAPQHWAAMCHS